MKREIKFRGKRIDNGEWAYGSLINNMFNTPSIIDTNLFENYDCWEDIDLLAADVDPETVGQYTGLKDRNGKEIYEGDVYRLTNLSLGRFSSQERYMNDEVVFIGGQFTLRNWNILECYGEVIGNIYDNPDLLEGEKK